MANFGEWNRFLESESKVPGNRRFIARNFILDEGPSTERVATYNEVAGTDRIGTEEDWNDGHEQYLTERIKLPRPASYMVPRAIDPSRLVDCPETFGPTSAFSTFGSTDAAYDLVRVVDAGRMARFAPRPSQFIGIVEKYFASKRDDDKREISATITSWLEVRDLRPVFAAFWYGVRDLFEDGLDDWADQLRDRMGLIRFNPEGGRKIPVLIFRYPVRLVPKLTHGHSDSRALVVPTVLDGDRSEAFCPVPTGQAAGFAVDLAGGLDGRAQEVVHPHVRFGAEHLYRIGYIGRRIADDLSEARLAHLLWMQDVSGRRDYAHMTDEDLLL